MSHRHLHHHHSHHRRHVHFADKDSETGSYVRQSTEYKRRHYPRKDRNNEEEVIYYHPRSKTRYPQYEGEVYYRPRSKRHEYEGEVFYYSPRVHPLYEQYPKPKYKYTYYTVKKEKTRGKREETSCLYKMVREIWERWVLPANLWKRY